MHKISLSLIMIILQPLYAMNNAAGFDESGLQDYHPGFGVLLKESMVLNHMRLSGPYAPSMLSSNTNWRHKSFENDPANMNYMTVIDNSCQYPCNAIAAFIQWCYPSLANKKLNVNTENDGSIGSLAALMISGSNNATRCFGFLLSSLTTFYIIDLEKLNTYAQILHNNLAMLLPIEINLDLFIEIMWNAIKLERSNKPRYYMEETVKHTMLSFLVDISQNQEQLAEIYNTAGLLRKMPQNYPLTEKSYKLAKESIASNINENITFDAAINFLALDSKFGPALEDRSPYNRNPFTRDQMCGYNLRIKNMNLNPTCFNIIQGMYYNLAEKYTPFFLSLPGPLFYNESYAKAFNNIAKESDLIILFTKHLLLKHQGEWDTLSNDYFYMSNMFLAVEPGKPLHCILRNMLFNPMGKIFIQHYLAPNYFPINYKNDFSEALDSALNNAYFDEMGHSDHLNKYQLLCFYGKGISLLEEISQNPNHPDYHNLFQGPLHEKHPLLMAVRHDQMPIVKLMTDNGQRAFWKVSSDTPLKERLMLKNALDVPEIIKFLIFHNPEILHFSSQTDVSTLLLLSKNLETFDIFVDFLTKHHGFNLETFLTLNCKESLEDPCPLNTVTFLDCLLLQNLGMKDEETIKIKAFMHHIKPDYKVSPHVLEHLITEVNCQRYSNQTMIDILQYATPDIIQHSLTNAKFDPLFCIYHNKKNEPLYEYFTNDIWCNFIREALDTNMDHHIWLSLNEMMTYCTKISDELQETMLDLFSQEQYLEKKFLLTLFIPKLLDHLVDDDWILVERTLRTAINNFVSSTKYDFDMRCYKETLSEQLNAFNALATKNKNCAQ